MLIFAAAWPAHRVSAQGGAPTVRLVVDYGDGVAKTIDGLAWAERSTILNAMKAAAARPHGISFSYSGSAATAVMTRIDDVQNLGGAGKKNWQYWVNAAYGNRSFAVFELHAGDVVLWRFAAEQEQ